MKITLALSLVANLVLAGLLVVAYTRASPAASKSSGYCEVLKKDLDFFIEGLSKGNDPLFTPIVVQSIGSLLPSCFPDNATMIDASVAELRRHLLHLVAQNSSAEQKRNAHDDALRILRDLRSLYDSST
jgi:hypothetical protein